MPSLPVFIGCRWENPKATVHLGWACLSGTVKRKNILTRDKGHTRHRCLWLHDRRHFSTCVGTPGPWPTTLPISRSLLDTLDLAAVFER